MAEKKTKTEKSVGEYQQNTSSFGDLEEIFSEFQTKEFKQKSNRYRFRKINQTLLQLVLAAPDTVFLLPSILLFIDKVNQHQILKESYNLSLFEFWLNHFSDLNEHDNYKVRAKIAGKYIPRDEYQIYFPIGMGRVYQGTHFVAAHLSPDVDTMIASFWGWLDAFAARVSSARHLWSLPGGPPDAPATYALNDLLGPSLFSNIPYLSPALTLSAIDLVSQKGFLKLKGDTAINHIDVSSGDKAVILIDDEGHYCGDWHRADVDPVRQILIRFKSCFRWFENNLHVKLISLFAKKTLTKKDIPTFLSQVFDVPISDCEPVKEFTDAQTKDLHDFFRKVLEMPQGVHSTFRALHTALANFSIPGIKKFLEELEQLESSDLFDSKGALKENRPAIFNKLETIIESLDKSIYHVRDYAERLDVAIKIKTKVLGAPSPVINLRSDVEDIRVKMQKLEYLTVTIAENDEKLFPIGVVWGNDLQRAPLGTVSFRDFCNQEETRMAAYLAPISVIDHHKASLKTAAPPLAVIGDAQSCNVLVAELAFQINSRYGLGGQSLTDIDKQIDDIRHTPITAPSLRILQRLLQKQSNSKHNKNFYVNPERELAEYVCFLYAILDDTDLLTKVSKRDVDCVVELLNRIKSIILRKEIEIIDLDDVPRDKNFASAAAKKILKHPEMYSFYRKIYDTKENEVERSLHACVEEKCESLFADTKEQNGCCRVGQTKLFKINFSSFLKTEPSLIEFWMKSAEQFNKEHPEIDLHLHMISTVPSAEEVYQDRVGHYGHSDELWFWVPATQKGYDHLATFLTVFQAAHKFGKDSSLEFLDPDNLQLKTIFTQNMPGVPLKKSTINKKLPVAILKFSAGFLNSRKAMVTPFLPKLPP